MKKLLKRTLRVVINFLYPKPAVLTIPHTSPVQIIKQHFGLGIIELNYSRPGIKGRKIFGDLVPFGELWRPGASGPTVLSFNTEVTIGGILLKPGKYGLLSIPDIEEWTLIITTDMEGHNFRLLNVENEKVRLKVKSVALNYCVDLFTMQFTKITIDYCEICMQWEKTSISLPITNGSDLQVLKYLDSTLKAEKKNYFTYSQAARYYFDNGKDLKIADAWIDKNLALPDNEHSYYVYIVKARIAQKTGNKSMAEKAAIKTIELATIAQNDEYVRMAKDIVLKLKMEE